VKNLIDQKTARLKMPGVTESEILTLTREVVALRGELKELQVTAAAPAALVPF
jgi:hypothetical protein